MDNIWKIAGLTQHGRLFGYIKAILNLLFIGSLTCAIFNKVYPQVQLPDLTSYNSIANYFLKGYFIIPLGIYFLLWAISDFLGYAVFELGNAIITEKWRKHISELSLPDAPDKVEGDGQNRIFKLAKDTNAHWSVRLYQGIRKSFPDKNPARFIRHLEVVKRDSCTDFILLLRSVFALVIYKMHVEYFGWCFFILLIFVIVIMVFRLFFVYQLCELIGLLVSKFERKIESNKVREEILKPGE